MTTKCRYGMFYAFILKCNPITVLTKNDRPATNYSLKCENSSNLFSHGHLMSVGQGSVCSTRHGVTLWCSDIICLMRLCIWKYLISEDMSSFSVWVSICKAFCIVSAGMWIVCPIRHFAQHSRIPRKQNFQEIVFWNRMLSLAHGKTFMLSACSY